MSSLTSGVTLGKYFEENGHKLYGPKDSGTLYDQMYTSFTSTFVSAEKHSSSISGTVRGKDYANKEFPMGRSYVCAVVAHLITKSDDENAVRLSEIQGGRPTPLPDDPISDVIRDLEREFKEKFVDKNHFYDVPCGKFGPLCDAVLQDHLKTWATWMFSEVATDRDGRIVLTYAPLVVRKVRNHHGEAEEVEEEKRVVLRTKCTLVDLAEIVLMFMKYAVLIVTPPSGPVPKKDHRRDNNEDDPPKKAKRERDLLSQLGLENIRRP